MGNPTDTGVASLLDPGLYEKAIEIVADDQNIDMLLVISTPVPACLEYVATAAKKISKPLAVSVFALPESEPGTLSGLSERQVAAYSDPQARGERACPHGRVRGVSERVGKRKRVAGRSVIPVSSRAVTTAPVSFAAAA